MSAFPGGHPIHRGLNYVWNTGTLTWDKMTQPGGAGGGTVDQGTPAALASAWPVKITDGTHSPGVQSLAINPTDADYGLITNSMIHGHTTAGGGAFVDVKVNPSGALTVDASGSTGIGVTGPLTDAQLRAAPVVVIAV